MARIKKIDDNGCDVCEVTNPGLPTCGEMVNIELNNRKTSLDMTGMVNWEISWWNRHFKKCIYCGVGKRTHIIFDPNVFPGNESDNKDHYWEVCEHCEILISQQMEDCYMSQFDIGYSEEKEKDD